MIFLGLSFFVTYMGQRTGIREVVWQEQSGLLDRLDRASSLITKFELLDLASPHRLRRSTAGSIKIPWSAPRSSITRMARPPSPTEQLYRHGH